MTDRLEHVHPYPILIDHDGIVRRTREVARDIADAAFSRDQPPLVVAVIEGARTFTRLLVRNLPGTPQFHELRASSYGDAKISSGSVDVVVGAGFPDVNGRDVVLVEDIVDTGRTIAKLGTFFDERGAASLRVATLLSKPSRRVVDVRVDHIGFEIEDQFVIGFGMDYAGRFRELLDVAIYDEALDVAAEGRSSNSG